MILSFDIEGLECSRKGVGYGAAQIGSWVTQEGPIVVFARSGDGRAWSLLQTGLSSG
jgi:hypothetical protein